MKYNRAVGSAAIVSAFIVAVSAGSASARGYRVVDPGADSCGVISARRAADRVYYLLQARRGGEVYDDMPVSLQRVISRSDFMYATDPGRLENALWENFPEIREFSVVDVRCLSGAKARITVDVVSGGRFGAGKYRRSLETWFLTGKGWCNPALLYSLVKRARRSLREGMSPDDARMLLREEIHDFIRDE